MRRISGAVAWGWCALMGCVVIIGCGKRDRPASTQPTAAATTTATATTRAALRNSPGGIGGMPMRVVAVSDGEIVVEPAFRFDDGSAASPRQTLQLDPERTQVFESVIVNQRTDDRGRIIMETKPRAVELERAKSLKEGQRVQVVQQAGVAVDIVIMPTLPTTRRATPRSATTRSRSRTTRPARITTQAATRS